VTVRKAQLLILFVLIVVMLILASAVLAQTKGKPYLEGMGAQDTGRVQTDLGDVKSYSEGQGADRTGSQILNGGDTRTVPEGEAGEADRSSAEEMNLNAQKVMAVQLVFKGVSNDGEQGSDTRNEATSIQCTNTSSDKIKVEVDVYDDSGSVYTGSISLSPNRTATFSTQNTAIYYEDVILGGSTGTGFISQGYGEVLSESEDVICSAQVLDPLNVPPDYITVLELNKP